MTFFAGTPVFLEKDRKPFVEGYMGRVYNPSIEGMEPIYRGNSKKYLKKNLVDTAIMKSTKSYIVGQFFENPSRKGSKTL